MIKYPKGKQQKEKDADKKTEEEKKQEIARDIIDPPAFLEFLQSEYSQENLLFLWEMQKLMEAISKRDVEQVRQEAADLLNFYAKAGSDMEVNIKGRQRQELIDALTQLSSNTETDILQQVSNGELSAQSKGSQEAKKKNQIYKKYHDLY